jgi:hypothetical protein
MNEKPGLEPGFLLLDMLSKSALVRGSAATMSRCAG